MPLYSYRCKNCGVQIERRQGFDDPPLKKCPECGENELRKVILPVGIVFKGPGFYSTDNRSDPRDNGKEKKAEKSESKEKSETKSEKSKSSENKTSNKED